jgi:hypothetical protein
MQSACRFSLRCNLFSLSGADFRRPWKPPRLQPWEGPFAIPMQRLPQAPDVAARQSAARRRWRARRAARARETAKSDGDQERLEAAQ